MTPEEKIKLLESKIEILETCVVSKNIRSSKVTEEKTLSTESEIDSQLELVTHEDINIFEIWNVIWAKRIKVLGITLLISILSLLYAYLLPNIYKSEALLISNSQEEGGNGLQALAGQFGGLASLAGVNLGSGGVDKTSYALEVLNSREFIYKFIEDNGLKVAIMGVDGWDRKSNSFTYDNRVYDKEREVWVRDVVEPFKAEPSLQETYKEFLKNNLSVTKDDESGMVKISISHYSPFLARDLVSKLIDAINQTIKQQDMEEAIKSIKYLEDELKVTKLSGAQTMFYQLIEQHQQTLMLTKVRDDYVLKVVDRPIIAEDKTKPNRILICILGAVLGFVVSVVFVMISQFVTRKE